MTQVSAVFADVDTGIDDALALIYLLVLCWVGKVVACGQVPIQ